MNDMALRKQVMFDAFVNKELGSGRCRIQQAAKSLRPSTQSYETYSAVRPFTERRR
jgi:hypothetical protein